MWWTACTETRTVLVHLDSETLFVSQFGVAFLTSMLGRYTAVAWPLLAYKRSSARDHLQASIRAALTALFLISPYFLQEMVWPLTSFPCFISITPDLIPLVSHNVSNHFWTWHYFWSQLPSCRLNPFLECFSVESCQISHPSASRF